MGLIQIHLRSHLYTVKLFSQGQGTITADIPRSILGRCLLAFQSAITQVCLKKSHGD